MFLDEGPEKRREGDFRLDSLIRVSVREDICKGQKSNESRLKIIVSQVNVREGAYAVV